MAEATPQSKQKSTSAPRTPRRGKTIRGQHVPAPAALTVGALRVGMLFVGLPFLALMALLDLALWAIFRFGLGACYGLLCLIA